MVKYYGRARLRIGSVNTNQIGLKMSGCPSKVGRQGYLNRYIASRVQCNQKFCGPVYYHGQLWKWNAGRCVAKAPRGQSFNSGVGHKNTPRFACGDTCATGLDALTAVQLLKKYFLSLGLILILVGKKETLASDGVEHPSLFEPIKHYYPGTSEYANLPLYAQQAVDVINSIGWSGPLKLGGRSVPHVVGAARQISIIELLKTGKYGQSVKFGPKTIITAYSAAGDIANAVVTCTAGIGLGAIAFWACWSTATAATEGALAAPALAGCAAPFGSAFLFCIKGIISACL